MFTLTTQFGVVGTQLVDLIVQVEQAAFELADLLVQAVVHALALLHCLLVLFCRLLVLFSPLLGQLRLHFVQTHALLLVALVDPLANIQNCTTRFVVVEQAGVCRGRKHGGSRAKRKNCAQRRTGHSIHHRAFQRLTKSARRFFAHAASSLPCTAGRSLPKLTASTCVSVAPRSVSALATDSARC